MPNIRLVRFFALILCLAFAAPLAAYDYGRLLPENLLFLVKVRLEQGIAELKSPEFPELEKTFSAMDARIEKELGMLPQRDLHEAGLYVGDDFDFSGPHPKPRNAAIFVLGAFKPELLLPNLAEILPKLNPRHPISVSIEEFQGKKLLALPRGRVFFRDNETFLAGQERTIRALAAPQMASPASAFAFAALPPEMATQLSESNFIVHLNITRALKVVMTAFPAIKIPMFVQDWSQRIKFVTLYENSNILHLMIGYDTPETAGVFKTNLEGFMGFANLFLENRDRSLDARIASGTLVQILTEFRTQKILIAVAHRMMKRFTIETSGSNLIVKITVPQSLKISPLAFTAAAGIATAIAIPKLVNMRRDAQRQSCLSTQARIAHAIERYNLENKEPLKALEDSDLRAGGKLIPFLGSPLESVEGCHYVSTDDLTKGGKVACMRHGSGK
ncbi:MAG: hypothetical protein HQM09_15525 [Candidatus Riflebacteria bacterium]|nr:hypothetical protein [Candidatus Riflebacteria bacterium]